MGMFFLFALCLVGTMSTMLFFGIEILDKLPDRSELD